MRERFGRTVVVVLLVLLAASVAQPYVDRYVLTSPEPRLVAPRADLAAAERSTIDVFQHASPSVVQVVGRIERSNNLTRDEQEGSGVQTGTAFV